MNTLLFPKAISRYGVYPHLCRAVLLRIHAWQDPSADTWAPVASMGTTRAGLGLASLGNHLYAAGGQNSNGYLATVEVFTDDNVTAAALQLA